MSGTIGAAVASAAEALVGARFRLHGRDPHQGLDCIGVVAVALDRAGLAASIPPAYGLRTSDLHLAPDFARRSGLAEADGPIAPGDILAVHPGPAQLHLLVAATGGVFIHAHAGLHRVVAMPGPLPWPVLHHWRSIERQ